jgi:glycosyltransferase involved in cell wall biosynthesis
MRVVFASNFLNHHQIPLCTEISRLVGDDFVFLATQPLPQERLLLGYEDMTGVYPWVHNAGASLNHDSVVSQLVGEADVLIMGDAPNTLISERESRGQLAFRYSERIFKGHAMRAMDPRARHLLRRQYVQFPQANTYLLATGAYAARDFATIGAYRGRAFKWGYFPEFVEYDQDSLLAGKSQSIPKLVWAGRFLPWKHPDDALRVARALRDAGYIFTLDMIGTGPLEELLQRKARAWEISDCVSFTGPMAPREVRVHMRSASILLMTSDRREGWGAVVNEAMNEGCIVVGADQVGSVPYLIRHGWNGMVYESGHWKSAARIVMGLLDDLPAASGLALRAHETIAIQWNARLAASRLVSLSDALLGGGEIEFVDGPCSRA